MTTFDFSENELVRVTVPESPALDCSKWTWSNPGAVFRWEREIRGLHGKIHKIRTLIDMTEPAVSLHEGGYPVIPTRWLSKVTRDDIRAEDRVRVKEGYPQVPGSHDPSTQVAVKLRGKIVEVEGSRPDGLIKLRSVKNMNREPWLISHEFVDLVSHNTPLSESLPCLPLEEVADESPRLSAARRSAVVDKTTTLEIDEARRSNVVLLKECEKVRAELRQALRDRDGALADRIPFAEAYAANLKRELDNAALLSQDRSKLRADVQRLHNYLARETPHALTREGNTADEAIAWLGQLFLEQKATQAIKTPAPATPVLAQVWSWVKYGADMVAGGVIAVAFFVFLLVAFFTLAPLVACAYLIDFVNDIVKPKGARLLRVLSADWKKTRFKDSLKWGLASVAFTSAFVAAIRLIPVNEENRLLITRIPQAAYPDDPREKAYTEAVRVKREKEAADKKNRRWF